MWFRRSIAFAAGSAILAGLVAAIVEAKKSFDEKEKERKEETEAEEAVTEEIELTPEPESTDEQPDE